MFQFCNLRKSLKVPRSSVILQQIFSSIEYQQKIFKFRWYPIELRTTGFKLCWDAIEILTANFQFHWDTHRLFSAYWFTVHVSYTELQFEFQYSPQMQSSYIQQIPSFAVMQPSYWQQVPSSFEIQSSYYLVQIPSFAKMQSIILNACSEFWRDSVELSRENSQFHWVTYSRFWVLSSYLQQVSSSTELQSIYLRLVPSSADTKSSYLQLIPSSVDLLAACFEFRRWDLAEFHQVQSFTKFHSSYLQHVPSFVELVTASSEFLWFTYSRFRVPPSYIQHVPSFTELLATGSELLTAGSEFRRDASEGGLVPYGSVRARHDELVYGVRLGVVGALYKTTAVARVF